MKSSHHPYQAKCPFCNLWHNPEKTHCNDPRTGALIRRAGPIASPPPVRPKCPACGRFTIDVNTDESRICSECGYVAPVRPTQEEKKDLGIKEPQLDHVKSLGQKECIVASAILQDGVVFTGLRHAFIIHDIVQMTGIKPVTGQQGFMTSKGEFVSREIAGEIALRAGQVTHLNYSRTQLFSEDLWEGPREATSVGQPSNALDGSGSTKTGAAQTFSGSEKWTLTKIGSEFELLGHRFDGSCRFWLEELVAAHNASIDRVEERAKNETLTWLGYWRDKMPAEAVSKLQDILGIKEANVSR